MQNNYIPQSVKMRNIHAWFFLSLILISKTYSCWGYNHKNIASKRHVSFSTHKTSERLWSICYLKGNRKFIAFNVYAFLDDTTSHKWDRYVFPHYDESLSKSFMDVTYLFCLPTHFPTQLPSPTVSPKVYIYNADEYYTSYYITSVSAAHF